MTNFTSKYTALLMVFVATSINIISAQGITSTNPFDFAPGGINTPNVSSYEQMLSFPLPRFKTGHTLLPNVPIFHVQDFGENIQPNTQTPEQKIAQSILVQKYMCQKWNYAIGFNNDANMAYSLIAPAQIQLANENPQFARATISHWAHIGFDANTHPSVSNNPPPTTGTSNSIYFGNHPLYPIFNDNCADPQYLKYAQYARQQYLSDNFYLRNANGHFLNQQNQPITGNTCNLYKRLSPATPKYLFRYDGQLQKNKLDVFANLLVPRAGSINKKFDILVENGELLEVFTPAFANNQMVPNPIADIDPLLSADFNQFCNGNRTGANWETYTGRRFAEFTNEYFQPMRQAYEGDGTIFAHYAIDGKSFWRPKYAETRYITTPVRRNMRYATPDFYPHAQNLRGWWGAWHGWEWIAAARQDEIALGDSLFSPFVTAGWSGNEAQNIRPGYWLALMKSLSVAGADFYYTSHFNGLPNQWTYNNPMSDPANFMWQFTTPVYAQALSTHFEDLLFNGHLLEGDRPNVQSVSPISYSFNAYSANTNIINENILITARKHNLLPRYVITAGALPSMLYDYTPEAEYIKTVIAGDTLTIHARKQGSTYIYDKSDAQNPSFYQLDAWHEATHPSYWSKDFKIDAEVYDNMRGNMTIKTERPAGAAKGNYTQFTGYASGAGTLEYTFEPRQTGKYYVSFLARSKSGLNTPVTININGTPRTVYVSGKNWSCYSMAANSDTLIMTNPTLGEPQLLVMTSINNDFEIDAILVTKTPNQCPTNFDISCNKPFVHTATGINNAQGSTSYNASTNTYTLAGAGNALDGNSDRCFYSHQSFVGDAEFTVKIRSLTYTDGAAKVGIMLRADLAPDAPNVLLAVTPLNTINMQHRVVRSGNTIIKQQAGQAFNNNDMAHWLRIKRTGKRFEAYYSTDNTQWTLIDTVRIGDFPNDYLIGLSVASNLSDNNGQTSATASDFSITQCPKQPTACIVPFDFIDAPLGNGTGNTVYDPSTKIYTTTATGNALNTNTDNCHYNFTTLKGNAEITLRIADITYTDGQTKAGIMLRSGLQANATNVFVGVNPMGQVYFQGRNIAGANTGISAITTQGSTPTNNWLKIKRTENYFQAYWSNNNDQWTLVGAVTMPNFSSVFLAGIATTSNSSNTTTANIDNLSIQNCQSTATNCEQPFNYVTQNIGGNVGNSTNNPTNGTYSVAGAGNIGGNSDAMQFAFKNIFGDVEVSMKINSLTYVDGNSKAGIMIRAGLAPNAANVYVGVTPINAVLMQYRAQAGGNTTMNVHQNLSNFSPSNMSHWVKLRRVGDIFKSYWSIDNINWVALDSVNLPNFSKSYLVGIGVASNDASNSTRAVLSNLLIKRCVEPDCNQIFSPYNNSVGGAVGNLNTGLSGTYMLASTGNDMLGTADNCSFATRNIAENAEIVTKINSLTYTNAQAKAGISMRTGLAPDAPMVFVGVSPTNQVYFIYRATSGDTAKVIINVQKGNATPNNMAHWLKLRRINNTFEAYYSTDNAYWEGLGSVVINSFAKNYLVGIVAASSNAAPTTAVFENLTIAKCIDGNANEPIFGSDIMGDGQKNYTNIFDLNNYPNPFRQITTINFKIPAKDDVSLTITDIYGKNIANLLNDKLSAGFYEIPYNAAALPSGTYIIQLKVGKMVAYKRMVVAK